MGFIPALIRALTDTAALGGRAISFLAVIAIYIASGISAGTVVGLLRPTLTNVFGAALAGIVAMIPVVVATRVAIIGVHGWSMDDVIAGTISALLLGGGGGIIIWRESRNQSS